MSNPDAYFNRYELINRAFQDPIEQTKLLQMPQIAQYVSITLTDTKGFIIKYFDSEAFYRHEKDTLSFYTTVEDAITILKEQK